MVSSAFILELFLEHGVRASSGTTFLDLLSIFHMTRLILCGFSHKTIKSRNTFIHSNRNLYAYLSFFISSTKYFVIKFVPRRFRARLLLRNIFLAKVVSTIIRFPTLSLSASTESSVAIGTSYWKS